MSIEEIKYNFFLNFFKKKKKFLWTLTNNLLSNSISTPTISVLTLNEDTSLGKKDEKIFVTNDSYQTWYIMNDKNFNQKLVDKVLDLTKPHFQYNLIDIGANTGLLARSLLNKLKNIQNTFLIEPDKENLFCIRNNLKNFRNINVSDFALDVTDGDKKLFIDKNNKGNLSFNYEMMTLKQDKLNFMNSKDNYEIVRTKSISDYFNEIKNDCRNIIKIDVQGYDEVIFQEIPDEILNKTDVLIIEITPLKSKIFDKQKFNSKLKCFKKYSNFNGDQLNIDEINKMTEMKSGKSFDLIFLN